MKSKAMVSIFLILIIVFFVLYLLIYGQYSWCPTRVEDKDIRGEMRKACLHESTYESGDVRIRAWETRDREYICQEFYKRNTSQYSITFWSENGRRCREIKRINNQFVPEGIECTEVQPG